MRTRARTHSTAQEETGEEGTQEEMISYLVRIFCSGFLGPSTSSGLCAWVTQLSGHSQLLLLSCNDTWQHLDILLLIAIRAGVGMGAPGMWWAEVRTALTETYPL